MNVIANVTAVANKMAAITNRKMGCAIDATRLAVMSAPLDVSGKHISFVADSPDQLLAPAPIVSRELAAQPTDLNVNRAVELFCVPAARMIENEVTGENTPRMLDQGQQKTKLTIGQVDEYVVGIEQFARRRID